MRCSVVHLDDVVPLIRGIIDRAGLLIMSNDQLYYEKIGADFDRFMSNYDVERRIALVFGELLTHCRILERAQVLEVGCGTGRISARLQEEPWFLTVNDISEVLCQRVAAKLGCEFLAGDCQALPCADERFDLIVSSECIEHTPDPWSAVAEMHRALRPGGWLVVTTPNRLWFPLLAIARKARLRKFDGIENWTWPFAMRRWLLGSGFSDVHFSGCHLLPWQIPLARRVLPLVDRLGPAIYPIMINYGFAARKETGASGRSL